MHKFGYYYLPEGKKIALQYRYSSNNSLSKLELPNGEFISKLS